MASAIGSSMSLPTPSFAADDLLRAGGANSAAKLRAAAADLTGTTDGKVNVKAKAAAQEFEAVFLNSMFSQMFSGLQGDGPMGGSGATGVWRSFLTDEYSKSFPKAGGVGIADQVYKALLAQQEARS